MMSSGEMLSDDAIVAATRDWLEKAVIGLNLCPFAKAVHARGQIRYYVSRARSLDELLDDLERELRALAASAPEEIDTTLVIHPHMFGDFLDYNDFLERADEFVEELGFAGELQIASFHPRYQFEGTEADDITNFTNRSPYPMLHLLRERSVDAAVAAFPEAETIYLKNMETMRKLGRSGWDALAVSPASAERAGEKDAD
jgi:hypothetical protein